jgi:hypothetical protein
VTVESFVFAASTRHPCAATDDMVQKRGKFIDSFTECR